MVDPIIIIQEADKLQGRVQHIVGLHLFPGNVEDNAVVAVIGAGYRAGHMDEVGVYKDQIPGPGNVFPVIEEKYPFAFYDVEDLVLGVKMFDTHVKFAVADHLLQGDAIRFAVVGDFFHREEPFCGEGWAVWGLAARLRIK